MDGGRDRGRWHRRADDRPAPIEAGPVRRSPPVRIAIQCDLKRRNSRPPHATAHACRRGCLPRAGGSLPRAGGSLPRAGGTRPCHPLPCRTETSCGPTGRGRRHRHPPDRPRHRNREHRSGRKARVRHAHKRCVPRSVMEMQGFLKGSVS